MIQPGCIFVYGTLKCGQVREKCWPRKPQSVEPATVRGILYDLKKYPALVEGSDLVVGELWRFAAEDVPVTLTTLDEVEGYAGLADDEYRRVKMVCQTANGEIRAWTYLYARADQLTEERRVRPDAGGVCRWPPDNTVERGTEY